ncbi:DUF6950 family protein [Idiomarina xiamenensis]|uniref:DUF6950 domain-containing protein n=1 Tax=Idiomarina xiamenensis 10-D-4 TaxID=740709 RepID=K2K9R9_9GAMM|nr:hypothetical protein [Idiomarina xiamenensis]EKE79729.1 hypothetical protein A10D4_12754 [Idiomarina xiamenensis 10-D-4]
MRLKNWPTNLIKLLQQRRDQPFEWGVNDCCLFAADAYQAIHGIDLADEFRGHYSTKIGAYRALKRHGYNDVADVLGTKLGQPKAAVMPERGDLLLVDNHGHQTAGVYCNGAWVVGEFRLLQVPFSWVQTAWSTK